MNKTGYLSVLSTDLYEYCKRFVYKRLFPVNLCATPTVLFECMYPISCIASYYSEITVCYCDVILNISTGMRYNHPHFIRDIGPEWVLNCDGDVSYLRLDNVACMTGDGKCVYVHQQRGLTAYNLHPLSQHVSYKWGLDNCHPKKILEYDEHKLLVVFGDKFNLIYKHNGMSSSFVSARSEIWDAAVDDEGKILLLHPFGKCSLWNSVLHCIQVVDLPGITKICLHNHTLLGLTDRDQKLVCYA